MTQKKFFGTPVPTITPDEIEIGPERLELSPKTLATIKEIERNAATALQRLRGFSFG